jgi:hypothetical protein
LGQSKAASVVLDPEHDPLTGVTQIEFHLGRLGMTGDVGQPLLGDPTEHQFSLLIQSGQVELELMVHRHPGVSGHLGRQRGQRAHQTKVVQDAWPKPARQAAHVVQARASGFLCLLQIGT